MRRLVLMMVVLVAACGTDAGSAPQPGALSLTLTSGGTSDGAVVVLVSGGAGPFRRRSGGVSDRQQHRRGRDACHDRRKPCEWRGRHAACRGYLAGIELRRDRRAGGRPELVCAARSGARPGDGRLGEVTRRRVAVIGGGLAGLAAGASLRGLGMDACVFERDDEPGGMVAQRDTRRLADRIGTLHGVGAGPGRSQVAG